mmetsp:Transcript_1262/g.4174  ORF Transcript_1262/g.4174 Transcript_1262/m.4174 type:complete len:229 (-) Transcript_1262:130-816(-)
MVSLIRLILQKRNYPATFPVLPSTSWQLHVPSVPCVSFRQVPVSSNGPFNACSFPAYLTTSPFGAGRSYTLSNKTSRVTGSNFPRSVNHSSLCPGTSALSSKHPAPNALMPPLWLAPGSKTKLHFIGFVGTEGSTANSSGLGQASPTHIPAIGAFGFWPPRDGHRQTRPSPPPPRPTRPRGTRVSFLKGWLRETRRRVICRPYPYAVKVGKRCFVRTEQGLKKRAKPR